MVYCGKLSKACLPCRKKRLLCDLRKDGCSQCSRAHISCTGYRDTSAIRIENQTTTVQRKAFRRTTATRPTLRVLNVSTCHQAREIFYHDHVFGETKGYRFLMQYYPPLSTDEHLCRSIDAVSLAYLAHHKHSSSALAEARRQYVDALRLIRKALQSPALVTKDSTILSILLLDMYEKISNKKPRYDGAWATHVKGALSLVQLRTNEQYRSAGGIGMLERLSTNILISCAVSDTVIPTELAALQAAVASPLKWRESELMVQFACLKRQAKHRLLADDEIVRNAMNLDDQFLELSTWLPPSWQHKTVYVEEKSAHHYETYHYVYRDEHMGQMWSVLRLTRILICELIFSHCPEPAVEPSLISVQRNLKYAVTTIAQLSSDICATWRNDLRLCKQSFTNHDCLCEENRKTKHATE